jgi:hypothetical protein
LIRDFSEDVKDEGIKVECIGLKGERLQNQVERKKSHGELDD